MIQLKQNCLKLENQTEKDTIGRIERYHLRGMYMSTHSPASFCMLIRRCVGGLGKKSDKCPSRCRMIQRKDRRLKLRFRKLYVRACSWLKVARKREKNMQNNAFSLPFPSGGRLLTTNCHDCQPIHDTHIYSRGKPFPREDYCVYKNQISCSSDEA